MAKKSKRNKGVGNLARLAPHSREDQNATQVIIETPKGSRNKYAFDPEHKVFQLTRVLPAGMAFPYDFGFVPYTLRTMAIP
jgi:inorganic pyrophosphatase